MVVAKVLSLSLAVLPSPGMTTYRDMRRAFGKGRFRSFQLAWASVAGPFRDFVILKRVMYGREDVSHWRIIERNSDAVVSLRETGQSFIVATAHFQRTALIANICPRVTPGNFVAVSLPPPGQIRSLNDLRLRIQYGALLKVLSTAWRRPFEFAFIGARYPAASLLYARLRKRGNIVGIDVDAPWTKSPTGSYSRPFAGLRGRDFSTGAAKLAALSQCPIVSCVCWQEDDGAFVLEWGSPIQHVDNEIDTMNRLIDAMEVAIGERPTQYLLNIGGERRWNATRRRWEDIAA